jgi:hypothetical protein
VTVIWRSSRSWSSTVVLVRPHSPSVPAVVRVRPNTWLAWSRSAGPPISAYNALAESLSLFSIIVLARSSSCSVSD